MRYLILSDIHANHHALEAVLKAAENHLYHRILILGDLVGYASGCNETLDIIRGLKKKTIIIRGNHDKVVCNPTMGASFNLTAIAAISWTRKTLTQENHAYLEALVQGPLEITPDLLICHGSPQDEDEYIFTDYDAYRALMAVPNRIILHGHTHIPLFFQWDGNALAIRVIREEKARIKLDPSLRYLINPGSVGQPRDQIPLASYAILDDKRNTFYLERVPYDIRQCQEEIIAAGLPHTLASRLSEGT